MAVKYTFVFEGLQKGAADMLFAESAAKKLGVTLAAIQGVRGGIPGLATGAPLLTSIAGGPGYVLQSNAFMAMGARALGRMGSIVTAGPPANTIQSFLNASLGIGAGQMQMSGAARAAYSNFWQSAVPPMIPTRPPVNWRMAGLGAAVAPFSPWLGARAMSNAFGGFLGGGGGAGGGITSAIFGSGGLPAFIAAFTAIKLTTEALRKAFEELHKGIKEGAKLYQEAAKTATNTGKLFQTKSALAAIGVDPAMAEALMLRGEHPLRGGGATVRVPGVPVPLGAGRGTAQIGELQQITNLGKEFAQYWRNAAVDSVLMSLSAKELFNIQGSITSLSREWHTLWAQVATDLGPAIITLARSLEGLLRGMNLYLAPITLLLAKLKLIDVGQPGNTIIPSGRGRGAAGTGWERMGFVIGGAGDQMTQYARETAQNTREIARGIKQQSRWASVLSAGLHATTFNLP